MTNDKSIDFYFDYASPYAYLANHSVRKEFPSEKITYKPIYLRGLEAFRVAMPFVPNKLTNMLVDLQRCADIQGLPFHIPSQLPINGIYACRGALFTLKQGGFEKYHQLMFSAAWENNIDISSKDCVIDIAVSAGLDKEAFTTGIDSLKIKSALKEQTAIAEKAGLFGVPSFIVGGELFWGADRIEHVKRKLTA
ncbi:hypothetical protein A9Q81_24860 [Gammaproteobacteria bacterium 42_54_T18]|nr:hypothetical protein A9Q81_24860 [Gammaproteobacteria bacterium 42_54_T18]